MVAKRAVDTTFVEDRVGPLPCFIRWSNKKNAPFLLGLHGRGSHPSKRFAAAKAFGEFHHVLPVGPLEVEEGFAWYLKGPEMDAHVRHSRTLLLELLAAIAAEYPKAKRLVWGFSQGGLMALELQLATPDPLAAAVSMGGKLHRETAADPLAMAAAKGRKFLLVHGTEDELAPLQLSLDAKAALDHAGALVDLAELPIAHEIEVLTKSTVRGYLAGVLVE